MLGRWPNIPITAVVALLAGLTVLPGQSDESWLLYDDSQVAQVYITLDPAALAWIYANVESDSEHVAGMRFVNALVDETVDSVGFRLRGNTSRTAQKKSFKVSFNTYRPGYQFHDVDKLNLNGEHNDPGIIRAKLCWDLFQKTGLISSRAAHVRLYINGTYYGLYISVEHLDDEFLQNHFDDDSGNLWKCLWPADLAYLGPDPDNYKFESAGRRTYDLVTNRAADDYTQLARLISIINTTPDPVFPDSLEKVLDVAGVLHYFAVNVLVGGWDDYRFLKNNYYLYHHPGEDRFHWIPYDYDNTFGIDWFNIDWATVNPYTFANIDNTPRPLSERMLAQPQYWNLLGHMLEFYHDQVTALPLWESRLDSLKDLITPWAELDPWRTLDYGFTIADFHDSYSTAGYSNQHVKKGLKEFVNLRHSSLPAQIQWLTAPPLVYDLDWWPRTPGPGDTIRVQAAAFSAVGIDTLIIQYHPGHLTVIEQYPLLADPVPGTRLIREADRWTGFIPPLGPDASGQFQVLARDINNQIQLFPRSERITIRTSPAVTGGVVINEFLALNQSVNVDEAGEYDDWLELYNSGSSTISLSGMYLTDTPGNLTKWQIPAGGELLDPGQYLLVWCDEDQQQGNLHTNFRISGYGEFLALVATDGITVLDSLSFGVQSGDISFGRYPDGGDWDFLAPTPGTGNQRLHLETPILPRDYTVSFYPNPFNSQTSIRISLPQAGIVTSELFDLRGRFVTTLVQARLPAGVHTLPWAARSGEGHNLGTGVYLYRVTLKSGPASGDLIRTGKLVYIK